MSAVACTVCEGEYHVGAGALANSLYRQGYRGELWVGYRGRLPPWARTATPGGTLRVTPDFSIRFVELEAGPPMAQLKPALMQRILDQPGPHADQVFFFDADVILVARWAFFEAWAEDAVALITDAWFPRVPGHHPWRKAWHELAQAWSPHVRAVESYHGTAFVGVPRRWRSVIDAWCRLTELYRQQQPERAMRFQSGDRMTDPFAGTDQDTFAAALMATDVPLCELGPEGLGCGGFAPVMLHPTGPKPWSASYLRRALRGRRPDRYSGAFWRHVDDPVLVYPPWRRRLGVSSWAGARALTRFYRSA